VALLLDQKNRITGVHVVSVGSLNASLVHRREAYKVAILGNAAAIPVLHNHPSGDRRPSREDREITQRLRLRGETLGIPLLDHVIVGLDGWRSFSPNRRSPSASMRSARAGSSSESSSATTRASARGSGSPSRIDGSWNLRFDYLPSRPEVKVQLRDPREREREGGGG
jgi:hypothetical protein